MTLISLDSFPDILKQIVKFNMRFFGVSIFTRNRPLGFHFGSKKTESLDKSWKTPDIFPNRSIPRTLNIHSVQMHRYSKASSDILLGTLSTGDPINGCVAPLFGHYIIGNTAISCARERDALGNQTKGGGVQNGISDNCFVFIILF